MSLYAMRLYYSTLLVILLVPFCSCSGKNSCLDIHLPENQHLEDTAGGWWIKELGLNYGGKPKYITIRMHDHLIEKARLVDKYTDDDKALTAVWEYFDKTKRILIEEKVYKSSDGERIWMTFKYPSPGVPWSDVIPSDHKRLKPDRKYEHAVTIHSVSDKGARLFLFGWGDYCKRISLF